MIRFEWLVAAGLVATSVAASAADVPAPYGALPASVVPVAPVIWGWEVRGGILAHDPGSPERGSADLNGELLLPKLFGPNDTFWGQFIPHPDIGFTANFFGKTSNIYGGAAWNFDITQRIFVSADLGLGINNGKTGLIVPPGHNRIGCNWWFHESASLGYRLTERWSVMGTIEHSSNAGACIQNRGVTNYGLRIGYQF